MDRPRSDEFASCAFTHLQKRGLETSKAASCCLGVAILKNSRSRDRAHSGEDTT